MKTSEEKILKKLKKLNDIFWKFRKKNSIWGNFDEKHLTEKLDGNSLNIFIKSQINIVYVIWLHFAYNLR